jgi:Protein of unknown function (DUF3108)
MIQPAKKPSRPRLSIALPPLSRWVAAAAAALALAMMPALHAATTWAAPPQASARHGGDPIRPRAAARARPLPVDIKVPTYTPGRIPFHDGEQLRYRVSWLGIPAADALLTLHRSRDARGSQWTAQVWIKTNKAVDLLFRMRDYMREDFSPLSLAPRDIFIRQHENRRRDEYRVTFDRRAQIVTAVKHGGRGTVTRRFSGGNPWGPFSGAMMALSQPLSIGQTLRFDVFSGNNRYVFDFNVAGLEHLKTSLGGFDAFKIEPSVVYLSDGKLRQQARETTVWISDDSRRLPLRMEAAVFIGAVRVDLVEVRDGGVRLAADP